MAVDTDYRSRIAAQLLGTNTDSLGVYFKVYDGLIARKNIHVLRIEEPESGSPHPITHDDILLVAGILRDYPTLTLIETCSKLSIKLSHGYARKQLETSVFISVQAMLMLDCAGLPESWHSSERFVDFVSRCFPRESAIDAPVLRAIEDRKAMKAWKLRARYHISFRGTDDLARHLLLDREHPEGPTLYIFHHAAFLKAQFALLKQHGLGKEDGVEACLKSGCLPHRLVAETFHSIQTILFDFDDHRSSRILERLITKGGFDEDCAQPASYGIFDEGVAVNNIEYLYWGRRLAELHAFVLARPPRNRFERWVKWQTSESNAFAVALVALLISIAVGILSLGLASFQTWIAWKAWGDSISSDDSEIVAKLQELVDVIRQQERQQ